MLGGVELDTLVARPRTRTRDKAPSKPRRRELGTVIAEIEIQPRSPIARSSKRLLDVIGATLGLIVLSPLFLLCALAVKLTSRGPALFVQTRCGLGGVPFKFYKFRTMVEHAEDQKAALAHLNEMQGPVFKIRRDPRTTRVGAVLRKLSLDELPQLWNVLRGDMSLVGPRPPTPDEVEQYSQRQVQRLSVLPGITGLWQVSGRSDIPDFEKWIELDLEYARQWTLWMDLRIMAKTVVVVLLARGAQ
jgi:exopolysaccharide biosynthesis polyprenyl glycosylphosphotransferase